MQVGVGHHPDCVGTTRETKRYIFSSHTNTEEEASAEAEQLECGKSAKNLIFK